MSWYADQRNPSEIFFLFLQSKVWNNLTTIDEMANMSKLAVSRTVVKWILLQVGNKSFEYNESLLPEFKMFMWNEKIHTGNII